MPREFVFRVDSRHVIVAAAALIAVVGFTAAALALGGGAPREPSDAPAVHAAPGATSSTTSAAPTSSTSSSEATTSTTTAAAPTATAAAPVDGVNLAPFVGSWRRRGIWVEIRGSGTGSAGWRTYRWCSAGAPTPCDSISGNNIVLGGSARFTIRSIGPPGHAHATAVSNQRTAFPNGPFELSLGVGDTLKVTTPGASRTVTLCGASATIACLSA